MDAFDYNDQVIEHFVDPRNAGDMEEPERVGTAGTPGQGPHCQMFVKLGRTNGSGVITWPALRASFWMWLLVPPGVLLGSWLNRKISPARFVVLIYIFLAISGVKLILDGTVLA